MVYSAYLHSVMKYVIYFGVPLQIVKGFLSYGSKVLELWLEQDPEHYVKLSSEYWKYWLYHHNIYIIFNDFFCK